MESFLGAHFPILSHHVDHNVRIVYTHDFSNTQSNRFLLMSSIQCEILHTDAHKTSGALRFLIVTLKTWR